MLLMVMGNVKLLLQLHLPRQNHLELHVHRWQVFSSSQLTPLCTDFPCTKYAGFFQELATSETLPERNLHDVECEDLQQLARAEYNHVHHKRTTTINISQVTNKVPTSPGCSVQLRTWYFSGEYSAIVPKY